MPRASCEVLPAAARHGLSALGCEQQDGRPSRPAADDTPDLCNGNSGNRAGNARRWSRGKEQLVVLAAVERLFERRLGVDGQGAGIDLGRDTRLLTEMAEIGGEPVAQIDAGRGQAAPGQRQSLRDARLGIEMRGKLRPERARNCLNGVVQHGGQPGQPARPAAAPPRLPVT